MPPKGHAEYLANQVMAASPEQLVIMAYDGALRFARVAREAMKVDDIKTHSLNILRAQDIIMYLLSTLNSDASPELSFDLSRIYVYIHGRLTDANLKSDVKIMDECIELLNNIREAWAEAEVKLKTPMEKAA